MADAKRTRQQLIEEIEVLRARIAELEQSEIRHQRAEDALRASEDKFRYVFDHSVAGMSITLPSGEVQANQALCEMLGYTPEDLRSQRWQDITHPDDIELTQRSLDPLLSGEQESLHFVKRYLHKDGSTIWADASTSLRRDRNGKPLYFVTVVLDITERKQAEEALRKSEEILMKAFRSSPIPMTITRQSDGSYLEANDSFLRMVEYSREEVIGRTSLGLSLVDVEEHERIQRHLQQQGSMRNMEIRAKTRSGRRLDVLTSSENSEFAREAITVTTLLDITRSRQAEEELRESEERFRRAIKEAPFPIMMHAEDGEVIALSNTWLELTGYSFEDVSTVARWTEKAFGDRSNLVKAEIDRLYGLARKVKEGEYTITTNRGKSRLWDFSSTPLGALPDGRRLVLSIAVDVTERRQAEDALLQANEQLALAQQSAGAGVWDWDMLTGQLDWSPELLRIFGLDTDDPPTLELWRSVLYPDEWQVVKGRIDEAIRDHKPLLSEFRIVKPPGEVRWINILGNTTYDEHGRARRMSGICIDVTDRKRMEEALQRANHALQASNEELDAFGHTVAHDLKSPLGNIIGYASLLTDEENPLPVETMRDLARNFEELGMTMDNIIEELMLLAGLRKAAVKMEPLNMARIVAEAQRRLTPMIKNSQAEIAGPPGWPQAVGYAPWVEEIWLNYISNAIKYGGQPPCIELGATQLRDQIRFWVRDNGAGLTEEQKARLFRPFERLDQANFKGHGLGLSIVQRIAEKMGGEVFVESTGMPGEGSTFGFVLPAPAHEDR